EGGREDESWMGQMGNARAQSATMKPRRGRARRGDVDERAMTVDAGKLVARAGQLGGDAPRPAAELDDPRARRDAEPNEPRANESVSRAMPEVSLFGRKKRGDVVAIGDVERRIVGGEAGVSRRARHGPRS